MKKTSFLLPLGVAALITAGESVSAATFIFTGSTSGNANAQRSMSRTQNYQNPPNDPPPTAFTAADTVVLNSTYALNNALTGSIFQTAGITVRVQDGQTLQQSNANGSNTTGINTDLGSSKLIVENGSYQSTGFLVATSTGGLAQFDLGSSSVGELRSTNGASVIVNGGTVAVSDLGGGVGASTFSLNGGAVTATRFGLAGNAVATLSGGALTVNTIPNPSDTTTNTGVWNGAVDFTSNASTLTIPGFTATQFMNQYAANSIRANGSNAQPFADVFQVNGSTAKIDS